MSTHPVTVIFVMESAIYFQLTVAMTQGDGRMMDAVEHVRLYHGIMNHVFEHNPLAHLQRMTELPASHVIPAQATVSAQPVNMLIGTCRLNRLCRKRLRPAHRRLVRHFQAIGHVAGKAYIENRGTDATAFYYIDHRSHQRAGLSGKG